MNLVLNGLYVGSCRDARNERELTEKKITHVVRTHDRAGIMNDGREQMIIRISDQGNENILQYLSGVNDFIHKARASGDAVLVHCMLGVSRSVTFVIAYIMAVTDLGWKDALRVVRSARHRASPNFGFKRQLQVYENEYVATERVRLAGIQPCFMHDDKEFCEKALVSYSRWVQLGDVLQDENESLLIEKLSDA